MAFGFFKKTQAADIIFKNGNIYTHDPDFPWAEAVACTDGKITAVGDFDAMDNMTGKNTEVIDLGGKYMFPGFIDIHRSPVMKVFEGKYLDLAGCKSPDEICEKVADWAKKHPEAEVIFGYGFKEPLEPESEALNACCGDRPVVLLAESGIGCAVNSVSEQIIQETAEEECVEVVTVGYVLNLLMPFDFEQVEADVQKVQEGLASQGVTTVLNQQTPDYFESLYQDSMVAMCNEGQIRQRFCGAYLMNRPLQPRGLIYTLMRRKTNCSELTHVLQANMLNVHLDAANCPMEFPQEAADQILLDVVDKGFQLFIEAAGEEDLKKAYGVLEVLRNKGYKNPVTIASDCSLPEEELRQLERYDDAISTWATCLSDLHPTANHCRSVVEAIDEMTVLAAPVIGMEGQLGKIEKGYLADFAVFPANPLDKDLDAFSAMTASMTILGGEVVYDAENM